MNQKIEDAKKALIYDLEYHESSIKDPIGNSIRYRKILEYIFVCVESGMSKSDIADWLYSLYIDQNDEEKYKFSSQIDLLIGAMIKFYAYIKR